MILYIILMVVAVIIVAVYCFLQFGIKPPEVDVPTPPTPPSASAPAGPVGSDGPGSGDDPNATTSPERPPGGDRRDQVYTCLIFGFDVISGSTDAIMVATFDVPNQKIGLVSIPRDTVVRRDRSAAWNKINAAYAAGGSNGVAQLEREVGELLGIPIDFYVKVRLSAFEKLVNAVDGVWFDVPRDMDYDDPSQNLHIHLQKGYQLLNGEQAMGLVRFRQDNNGNDSFGDVGRAGVQQEFLKAMLGQVISGASVTSIPSLIDVLLNHVETDADMNACLYFGRALLGMDLDGGIETETLPSSWRNPYMWVDKEEALETINRLLNPWTYDVTIDMVEFFDQ